MPWPIESSPMIANGPTGIGSAELVRHRGDHARDRLGAGGPRGGVRRVGVHDAADLGHVPVHVGVRGGVAGRAVLVAPALGRHAVEGADDLVLGRQVVARHPARLDDEEVGAGHALGDVAAGPDHQAVADEFAVQAGDALPRGGHGLAWVSRRSRPVIGSLPLGLEARLGSAVVSLGRSRRGRAGAGRAARGRRCLHGQGGAVALEVRLEPGDVRRLGFGHVHGVPAEHGVGQVVGELLRRCARGRRPARRCPTRRPRPRSPRGRSARAAPRRAAAAGQPGVRNSPPCAVIRSTCTCSPCRTSMPMARVANAPCTSERTRLPSVKRAAGGADAAAAGRPRRG